MAACRDFSFLQTKTQANSLVRLGYDVRVYDKISFFFWGGRFLKVYRTISNFLQPSTITEVYT